MKSPLRFLICTHHFHSWAGSELVALELAEYLASQSHSVDFYCFSFSEDFLTNAIGADSPITTITSAEEISISNYDVVYAQHQMISRFLSSKENLKSIKTRKPVFIYNHLSPFEPFELPGPFVEELIADIVLCNSIETRSKLIELNSFFKCSQLFENPAPYSFHSNNTNNSQSLQSILIISNHLPEEVLEAIPLLEAKGIKVAVFGRPNNNARITADVIGSADAIVTIGKSVQYAFRAGKRVYCYDKFGGPGWISSENLENSANKNFSGRSNPTVRTANELATDIIHGYSTYHYETDFVSAISSRYALEVQADTLVDEIRIRMKKNTSFSAEQFQKLSRLSEYEKAQYDLIDRLYNAEKRLILANDKKLNEISLLKAELRKLNKR